jgi:hypothetical protein
MQMMRNAEEKPRAQSPSTAFHDRCEMEQKECLDNCTILYRLASNDLHKFSILHQVFGACNVIKLIQVSCNYMSWQIFPFYCIKPSSLQISLSMILNHFNP